eukprot:scaffold6103_cov146-Skeletonema_menzelii.AAC.7
MLSACASSIARASARTLSHHRLQASAAVSSHFAATTSKRTVTSKVGDRTAEHAWNKSCYSGIDYTISEDANVFDMVEKMAAYDVGCLVTKDKEAQCQRRENTHANISRCTLSFSTGKLSGVVSERDYVTKVALLGNSSKDMKVKQISTKAANLVMARPYDTVDACMDKMLSRDIRHLPLIDDMGQVVGIISIKDLIKECLDEKEHTLNQLASFAVGEGGHFVM